MTEITLPYHLITPSIISILILVILLFFRKKLFKNRKKKSLWFSLTIFFILYLFIVVSAIYDDIYSQWNLNNFDINKDGFFSEDEITENQAKAMSALTNDLGKNLAFVTGVFFALPFAIFTYVVMLIITRKNK